MQAMAVFLLMDKGTGFELLEEILVGYEGFVDELFQFCFQHLNYNNQHSNLQSQSVVSRDIFYGILKRCPFLQVKFSKQQQQSKTNQSKFSITKLDNQSMDILRSRFDQMHELSNKLQTSLAEVQQYLHKLVKLSNPKDSRLKMIQSSLIKRSTRKQQEGQGNQKDVQFVEEESSQSNNNEQRQDQTNNETQTGRTQIVFNTSNSNNKTILSKNGKPKPKLEMPKLKAPLSPFFLFMRQKRDIVKQQYPDLPPNHIAKIFGKLWKTLTPQQRKPYYDSYARSHSNYLNFVAKIGHKIDDS